MRSCPICGHPAKYGCTRNHAIKSQARARRGGRCYECGGYEAKLEYGLCPRCLKEANARGDEMQAIGEALVRDEGND